MQGRSMFPHMMDLWETIWEVTLILRKYTLT